MLLFVCIFNLKKNRIEKSENVNFIDALSRFFNMSIKEDTYIYYLRVVKFLSITFIIYMYHSFFPYHSPNFSNRILYEVYKFYVNLFDIAPIYVMRAILELYFMKEVAEFLINTIWFRYVKKASR